MRCFFLIWPIVPLYFCPREEWPLVHIPTTSLSPHSCTVGPSSRVWMVKSAGHRILGASSTFCFSSFPYPVYCREVHTIKRKSDESFLILQCTAYCSFTNPVLLSSPFGSQLLLDTPSIIPTTLVLQPCVVVRGHLSSPMLAWTATFSCFSI